LTNPYDPAYRNGYNRFHKSARKQNPKLFSRDPNTQYTLRRKQQLLLQKTARHETPKKPKTKKKDHTKTPKHRLYKHQHKKLHEHPMAKIKTNRKTKKKNHHMAVRTKNQKKKHNT